MTDEEIIGLYKPCSEVDDRKQEMYCRSCVSHMMGFVREDERERCIEIMLGMCGETGNYNVFRQIAAAIREGEK